MKMSNNIIKIKMMNTQKMKIILMSIFAVVCCMCNTSCSDNDAFSEGDNYTEGGTNSPTKIIPILDWGASLSEIKSQQHQDLSLEVATESLLKYTNKAQEVTIDYNFEEGKLIGASLTQAKISDVNDIIKSWLKDYNELAKSEKALLYVSKNNSTLACCKILQGSEYDYATMAWTYIDKNEETSDGPDFSPSGTENGHDYVDLGIGIGWAVQNVGASSPEQPGGYYMWGETTTKSNCWWWYYSLYRGDTNSYLDEDKFYSPYSNISSTNYDAAKVKMGGNWRMPTRAEFYTLINNCEFKVGEYNGVSGFIVTGPSGKSIFLPATGQKKKNEIQLTNTIYLWSATTYGKSDAYHLKYMTKNLDASSITFSGKYYGMPIRGVVDIE